MRVTITRPVTHLCPYKDERDLGTVEASWDGDGVELHALAAFIDSQAQSVQTHEALTDALRAFIEANGGDQAVVITRWRTAGMDVEVTA